MRFNSLLAAVALFTVAFATKASATSNIHNDPNAAPAKTNVSNISNTSNVDTTSDPWESINQPIFDFNVGFDRYLLHPVAQGYHYFPAPVRTSVGNVLTNLSEPLNAIHGVLQLNPKIAFTSLWRFILNTTFGFGGIRNFAGENGLHNMDQNLGKTLGRWGVGTGPYLVIPVLGPSSLRDATGKIGDFFIDPVTWDFTYWDDVIEGSIDGINTRDKNDGIINHLYYESLDPYASTRSFYRQHEAFEVNKKE